MTFNDIISAVNLHFKQKFPDTKGLFIGKINIETLKGPYKKFSIQLWYHDKRGNSMVMDYNKQDRVLTENQDKYIDTLMIPFVSWLLSNTETIDKYGTI